MGWFAWAALEIHGGSPSAVLGVPTGGERFADMIRQHARVLSSHTNRILVVDDVWTTGGSVEAFISERFVPEQFRLIDVVVMFARGEPHNLGLIGVDAVWAINPFLRRL